MPRRSRIWIALAVLFTLGNIAGGVYAGMMGEMRHAGIHVVLAAIGAYVAWLMATRRADGTLLEAQTAGGGGQAPEIASRLNHLEQSLDAIAVEVERVGEGQRFITRLFTERGERDKNTR